MTSRSKVIAVGVGALLVWSCSEPPSATEPKAVDPGPQHSAVLPQPSEGVNADQYFDGIAKGQIPGFGGMYIGEDRAVHIPLTNRGLRTAAEALASSEWARIGRPLPPVVIEAADYSFHELFTWKELIRTKLDDARLLTLDANEKLNRLVLGVTSASAFPAVSAELEELGIPREAVELTVQEPLVPRVGLTDSVRPVRSSFRIAFGQSGDFCTLGLNARSLFLERGFVTASHCSEGALYANNHTVFYQAYRTDPRIGVEAKDPPKWDCDGGGVPCRWSDALVAIYDSGVGDDYGYLTTTSGGPVEGRRNSSLTVDPNHPKWRITSATWEAPEDLGWLMGSYLNKIGVTSGWTRGPITGTCVENLQDAEELRCSLVADIFSWHGDSGAALFSDGWEGPNWGGLRPPPDDVVAIYGILFYGPQGDSLTTWFSPFSGVKRDLGLMFVCQGLAC